MASLLRLQGSSRRRRHRCPTFFCCTSQEGGETHEKEVDAYLTDAAAGPGHILVRHFCDWTRCYSQLRIPWALQRAMLRVVVLVRRRGRLRVLGAGSARTSTNAR